MHAVDDIRNNKKYLHEFTRKTFCKKNKRCKALVNIFLAFVVANMVQVVESPVSREAVLDFLLTNREELLENLRVENGWK